MRFDRVTIPLAPLTTANCLDLALLFLRRHFRPIMGLWAVTAALMCAITYGLVNWFDGNLSEASILFFMATSPLGVYLMIGAAPAAFGEPFTIRDAGRGLGWRLVWLLGLVGILLRVAILLGLLLFVIPGFWLAVRKGFFVEQAILAHLAGHLHDRRTSELLKGEMGELFQRGAWITLYCGLLWCALFVTLDLGSELLLGLPILIGRVQIDMQYLEGFDHAVDYAFSYLWNDPLVVTVLVATALAVYPLGRLAWFFCYIDVRVRRDCWDMELQILSEARRLEEGEGIAK